MTTQNTTGSSKARIFRRIGWMTRIASAGVVAYSLFTPAQMGQTILNTYKALTSTRYADNTDAMGRVVLDKQLYMRDIADRKSGSEIDKLGVAINRAILSNTHQQTYLEMGKLPTNLNRQYLDKRDQTISAAFIAVAGFAGMIAAGMGISGANGEDRRRQKRERQRIARWQDPKPPAA